VTETTRIDPHVKILDERVVDRAKAHGLDGLVYAPHFERLPAIRGRARSFSDDELFVVPGREIFTGTWRERRHIIAVGLEEPVPDFIPLEAAVQELKRQDAAVLVPHPNFITVSLTPADIKRYRTAIDAVETYNPKQRALGQTGDWVATDTDLPAFGSSYAHLHRTIGDVWTTVQAPIETEAELVGAFASATPRTVGHRAGAGHKLRSVLEFAHLGWENSWGKIERCLLSGMEQTHPRHIAYDGRFDDVALY